MEEKLTTKSLCDFCLSDKSKYCCSRCHRRYCSADCFKSVQHMNCSEEFFKNCVTEELMSQQFDESSKQKFLEMLRRNDKQFSEDLITEGDNDEEENEGVIESRFNDLDISDSRLLLNKLTDSERQQFNELLKSGKIGDFVDEWNPWWKMLTNGSNNRLIRPLDVTPVPESSTQVSDVPDLVPNIHKLNDLISKPVSPSVCPTVVNTLLSYCYVCRLFNGDYDSFEAIQTIISKCPQLSDNINCSDLSKSLEMSIQQIIIEQPSHIAIESIRDLKCLIEGPKLRTQSIETSELVLRALSDLISTINKVIKKTAKQNKKQLVLLSKKLDFFLSWSVANGSQLIDCLPQINLIIETMSLSAESNRTLDQTSDDLREKLKPKPKTLIQEIN